MACRREAIPLAHLDRPAGHGRVPSGVLLSSMGHVPRVFTKALVSSVYHVASWGVDLGLVRGQGAGPQSAGRSPEPGQGDRQGPLWKWGRRRTQPCARPGEGSRPVPCPLCSGLGASTRPSGGPALRLWGAAGWHQPPPPLCPCLPIGLSSAHVLTSPSQARHPALAQLPVRGPQRPVFKST